MEDSSSENSDGGTAWWCIISFRLFAADIFFQSNRRTFRSRNFFRSENGRGTYNDRVFEIYRKIFFVYTDSCSIYRVADLDGIYPSDVEKSAAYGISSCRRNHDRIYLFGYHGFCCNLCG